MPAYEHLRINCGADDCDPNDPQADCDGDDVPNGEDKCPGKDDRLDLDGDLIPDGCDDDRDGDGIDNDLDVCADDLPGEGYVDADRDGCEDVVNPPVSCIPTTPEGCERFSDSFSKTSEIQVIALAIGDLTLEFTGEGLSVGLTPVAPFEFSDIEVTIGNTVVCIAEVIPDQGGTTVFAGLSAADLPISVGLKVNFCNISQ